MACTVTEGARTVEFANLELGEVEAAHSSYPLPPLTLSTEFATQTLSILNLENDFLSVVLAPSLGGRIIEMFDKRTHQFLIECPQRLPLVTGGARGVESPFGIQLILDGSERLNSMAPLDSVIRDSGDGDSTAVTFADSGSWPLSFHLTYELFDGSTELTVRAEVFNRSLGLAHYNAGLIYQPECPPLRSGLGILTTILTAGPGLYFRSEEVSSSSWLDGTLSLRRFDRRRVISSRQLDSWAISIRPIRASQKFPIIKDGLAITIEDKQVSIDSSLKVEQIKLLVQTASGETLEANLSLSPDTSLSIPLREQDLPLQGVAVLDRNRQELVRSDSGEGWTAISAQESKPDEPFYEVPSTSSTQAELNLAIFDVRTRALAHNLFAIQAIQANQLDKAAFHLEQVLLFNGEDHLAWWLKARCEKLNDPNAEGNEEILNAHYLAPLEPLLRAEALLNQAIQSGSAPNPILEPYSDDRDAILETSGELIQAGLLTDAMRLIGEWMRIRDFPMLRYLLAYCYLKGTRMTIEAGEQVRVAGTLATSAPYPVRPIEAEILAVLAERWPNDIQLLTYSGLSKTYHQRLLQKAIESELDLF